MVLARSFDSRFADRSALSFLPSLLRFPALVWANRYMVQNFLRRDVLARVNGSALGVGWLLLQPLFQFAVYFVVFGLLFGDRSAQASLRAEALFTRLREAQPPVREYGESAGTNYESVP